MQTIKLTVNEQRAKSNEQATDKSSNESERTEYQMIFNDFIQTNFSHFILRWCVVCCSRPERSIWRRTINDERWTCYMILTSVRITFYPLDSYCCWCLMLLLCFTSNSYSSYYHSSMALSEGETSRSKTDDDINKSQSLLFVLWLLAGFRSD